MELNKCPNCSGKLELAANRKKMVCPYCGSEFSLGEGTDTEETAGASGPINKDWFIYEWNLDQFNDIPKCKTVIDSFIRFLNEYDSAKALEEHIRTYLLTGNDISAPGIREQNMAGIMSRISSDVTPGEHVVLYYDDGLFSHGKTGVVVTETRTLFVEKKKIDSIEHSRLPYLLFEYSVGLPSVKLGERYSRNLTSMGSNFELVGAVAALVCLYSFEANPGRPKIKLVSA